jgi:light-regulated signal transduction histidine kinase (bacteriophytochrome)
VRGTFGIDESGGLRDERQQRLKIDQTILSRKKMDPTSPVTYFEDYAIFDDANQLVGKGEVALATLWDGKSTSGYVSTDNLLKHKPIAPYQREILGLYAQVIGHLAVLKNAEAVVLHLNASLEKRVEQRTAQLEQSNREMRSFSYSISHDLRSPLRTIDGFSQILLTSYSDQLDDQAQNYLQRIRSAAQHMAELIDALLKLTHIARNEIEPVPVNLTRIANEISARLHETAPDRTVHWTIQAGLTCHGDEAMMRLLLENLLGNAWKFSSKHLSASIEFGLNSNENRKVFFVQDDGAGFEMAYASKLFSPFTRLHASADFEGTGIGLAIVQSIIQRHRGEIWADSTPEKGATFYFTLPAC